jgi:nucleotide-binding universal stress UspA family protein
MSGNSQIHSILVPLDGSDLAEQAIPTAVALAERAGSKLKLLLVREPLPMLEDGATYTELELAMEKADRDYLHSVAGRLRERLGPALSCAVVKGPVTKTLARYTRELRTDLVVMTTHGRGGIRRAWLGSVADELIRTSEVPILIVRPNEAELTPAFAPPTEILVPLDGSPLAEAVLEPVAALARLWDAEVSLVQIVQPIMLTSDPLLPFPTGYSDDETRIRREVAEDYIRDVAERLRASGVKASGVAVIGGGAAHTILDLARPEHVSIVAVATHGLGGLRRLVLGSVADKLVRGADVPVLVVRPTGSRARRKSEESDLHIAAPSS